MFATTRGTVRRNDLSDFTQINRNGKIAMKLEESDGIVGVEICTETDDVLLTTTSGQAIRFQSTDVRLFQGRNSTGVRGIQLADGQEVIEMTILRHVEADPAERTAYLKQANAMRRAAAEEGEVEEPVGDEEADEEANGAAELSPERYAELSANEQFVLTVSENGYGKRTSAYEYRVTGRGGKGLITMVVNERNGPLIASFPVEDADQIMLVTDAGQLIRCPVADVRVAGRNTQGVTIFNTAEDEKVVSVEHIPETDEDDDGGEDAGD